MDRPGSPAARLLHIGFRGRGSSPSRAARGASFAYMSPSVSHLDANRAAALAFAISSAFDWAYRARWRASPGSVSTEPAAENARSKCQRRAGPRRISRSGHGVRRLTASLVFTRSPLHRRLPRGAARRGCKVDTGTRALKSFGRRCSMLFGSTSVPAGGRGGRCGFARLQRTRVPSAMAGPTTVAPAAGAIPSWSTICGRVRAYIPSCHPSRAFYAVRSP